MHRTNGALDDPHLHHAHLQRLLCNLLQAQPEIAQHDSRDAAGLANQADEKMLGTDVRQAHVAGEFPGHLQRAFGPRGQRELGRIDRRRPALHQFFDLRADAFQTHTQSFQHVRARR